MYVNRGKNAAVKFQVSSDGKVGVKWALTKYNSNKSIIIISSQKYNLYKLAQLSKGKVTP